MIQLPDTVNTEAEIIGGIMEYGTDCAIAVLAEVQVEDFSHDGHQEIMRVVQKLLDKGEPPTAQRLMSQWKALSEQPPPLKAFAEYPLKCPTQEYTLMVSRDLAKASRRRRLLLSTSRALELLQNPTEDEETAIGEVLNSAGGVSDVEHFDGKRLATVLTEKTEERYNNKGRMQGIATGYRRFDAMTDGLQLGELAIFGARPSQGKSAVIANIACHAAFKDKVPVLFVSLEMPAYSMARRFAACEGEIDLRMLRNGEFSDKDFSAFTGFCTRLARSPLQLVYSPSIDTSKLALLVRQYVASHKVKLVVVDYLQRVRPVGKHEKMSYAIGSVSTALKAIAVRNNVAMLTAAQLNRSADNEPPHMGHLADSSGIEKDGDLIALIHYPNRAEEPEKAIFSVAKQRDGETGGVPVRWNPSFVRFENPPIENVPSLVEVPQRGCPVEDDYGDPEWG